MSFLDNIDEDKIVQLMKDTQDNVGYFESLTSAVVRAYSEPLDRLMDSIYHEVILID